MKLLERGSNSLCCIVYVGGLRCIAYL